MFKYGKKILLTIFLLALVFAFCSCSNKEEVEEGEEKEEEIVVEYANINTIEVQNKDQLEETGFLMDDFSVSSVKLLITYISGETVEIPVSDKMIRAEDKAKLSVAGTHSITLYYGKFVIEFKLKLYRNVENTYRVAFMDWEGNRLGDVQYLKEGQIASVPNLESREGFQFIGWKNSVTGEIVTSFVFLTDATLIATYAPEYYSVDYYYVVGDEEIYLASENVRRGANAYDYAPAIPILEGYSNGRWDNVEAMKNVDQEGLKFYAVFDKDYVNATFVYYKYQKGEWYSYDVYWKVSEANEGISAPDDVRRVSSDIFLYWYVKHGDAEVRVDFPYVLKAETTFYAKYIPSLLGSAGIGVRYVDAAGGEVDKEGYYITEYTGNDDIIAIASDAAFADDVERYVFVAFDTSSGVFGGDTYCRSGDYVYKTSDAYPVSGVNYYKKYSVTEKDGAYYIYLPAAVGAGESVPGGKYYEHAVVGFALTGDLFFESAKQYYIRKKVVIQNGTFYLEESFSVGDPIEADKYYYLRDNAFILLTEATTARFNYTYYTKMDGLAVNGTSLFAWENRTQDTETTECYVPQNKTMILGILGHPFAGNGAERFYVDNNNTVFRINNDSLYSIDLKTLYAFPTGKNVMNYTVETKRLSVTTIADYAFYGAKNLVSVRLPESIVNIGEYAFAECTSLTSFTFPSSVQNLGGYAFYGDAVLTSYVFPADSVLTTIGDYAFAKNYLLETFSLPLGVTSIGRGLFADCVSLTQINADNDYFIVDRANGGLYGQKDSMTYYYLYAVPAKFPGSSNGVITINSGTRIVCTGAFSYTNLYEIAFESKNNSIVFESGSVVCPTLKTFRLNCTTVTFDDLMFSDPISGEEFLPRYFYLDSATSSYTEGYLDASAFDTIERREYSDIVGRAEYRPYSEDFGYMMVTSGGEATVTITGYRGTNSTVAIPSIINNAVVTAVEENAFRGNRTITQVAFPDSVVSIGKYAFCDCDNLQKIILGDGLEEIGEYAFFGCKNLSSIEFTDMLNIKELGAQPFGGAAVLTGSEFVIVGGALIAYNGIRDVVTVPDNVYLIADSVFYDCDSIEKLVFGADSQLRSVLAYAFYDCDNIEEIAFPVNLEKIEKYAFSGCARLFAVVFTSDAVSADNAFFDSGTDYFSGATNVFRPGNTSYDYSFADIASGHGYYVFSAPAGQSDSGIFEGWYNDAGLSDPAVFPQVLSADKVFYAGRDTERTFTDGLVFTLTDAGYEVTGYTGTDKYVTVPETYLGKKVVSVGQEAFLNKNIVYFSLPSTVKSIGRNAFLGTTWYDLYTGANVTLGSFLIKYKGYSAEYRLPDSVRYIADGAFSDNDDVINVYFNDYVSTVPAYCFFGCDLLETVVLGKAVSEIDAYAFADCASLKTMDFSAATHLSAVDHTAFNNSYWRSHYPDDSIIINKIYYAYLGSNETLHVPNSLTLVNPYAFYGNKYIRYVYIPESVLTIGECAFAESRLEKLFFATTFNNLTTIEDRAFYNCRYAVDYNFRSCLDLVYIGEEAFFGVKRKDEDVLLTFYVPEATEYIGEKAFAESDVYTVYFAEGSRLVEIAQKTFFNCKELVSVRFFGESYLQTIGSEAFSGCNLLKTFTNDTASISDIGEKAFYKCAALTVLGVNESSLVSVGNNAFEGSGFVDTNDVMVFLGSVLMKYNGIQSTVYVPAETTEIACDAFISNNRIGAVEFAGSELLVIRSRAFMDCNGINKFILPDSIESIEVGAFAGCTSLASFTVQTSGGTEGYVSVSGVLFRFYTENGNRYAELVAYPNKHAGVYEVPASIAVGGNPYVVVGICDYAFYKCTDLRQITLPSSLVSIGQYAFFGCSSLLSVTLPASMTYIGERAFSSCPALGSLTYGGTTEQWYTIRFGTLWMGALRSIVTSTDTINTIANGDIYRLHGILYRINDVGGNYEATVIGYEEIAEGECVIDEYIEEIFVLVTSVAEDCFAGESSIQTLILPSSIKTIGSNAFMNCTGLETVRFAGTVGDWCGITFGNADANPLRYADDFFVGENMLENAVLPSTLTEINAYAFIGYQKLSTVTLPAMLTMVGNDAFMSCSALTAVSYAGGVGDWCGITFGTASSNPLLNAKKLYIGGTLVEDVVLPASVTEIKDYAFSYSNTIVSVACESGSLLVSVGANAFSYCTELTTVTLPASLINIDDNAFYTCSSLATLAFEPGCALESVGDRAFASCGSLTSVELPDSVTTIGELAFGECAGLVSVILPDSLTTIGDFVFDGCPIKTAVIPACAAAYVKKTSSLESLTITSGTSLADNAFSACGVLTTLVLPATLTSVGTNAFLGCPIANATIPAEACAAISNPYLQSVTVISGETIAQNAFANCTLLASVSLASTVIEICDGAFSGCSVLTTIRYGGTTAQWPTVLKGVDWNSSTGEYVIKCSDGDLPK